jgi:hypothetical protein
VPYAVFKVLCDRKSERRRAAVSGGGFKASGTCYAFQKGECTRGDACRFSHE